MDSQNDLQKVTAKGDSAVEDRKSSQASVQPDHIDEQEEEQQKPKEKCCNWRAWLPRIPIILVILGVILWVILDFKRISGFLESFIEWIRDNGVLGPFVLVLVYIVATLLFIPGLILTLGAGFAFAQAYGNIGVAIAVGALAVWTGAMIGSILAMLLGRYVFRDSVKAKALKYKTFGAIDKAVEKEGLKLTFLLRLSPLIPFNLFNYFMGITGVSVRNYSIGGFGMIPGTLVYVYFGSALSNISDVASGNFDGGVLNLVLLIGGSVLAFIAVVYVSYVAKKEVNKTLKAQEAEEQRLKDEEAAPAQEVEERQNPGPPVERVESLEGSEIHGNLERSSNLAAA